MIGTELKRTLYLFLPLVALVLAVVGCGPSEGFVVKEEGMWNIVSEQTVRYEDGTFVSDLTKTDSLGSYQFQKAGGGTYFDATGAEFPITWSINKKDDSMVIYSVSRPFVNAAITSNGSDDMTLRWNNIFGEGAILVLHENTTKLKRAN